MTELMDIRLHHHIANEIYRQQMMQRIPDPYPTMLPVSAPRQIHLPPRYGLHGVSAKLQNSDLWSQFHQIGTEMIITKSGRRMFPSLRVALSGLEDDANYCVLLEMVPIGDCRYKFSGTQWVPAGGAEPQSTQRMYLHPDSPALGAHWAAQPVLFNKVKLTNNTLDSCGHVVLTSMHKYQPRLHIIRTADPTQIPWAPQQGFSFAETEFVAVTAYQNERITKLKIDNNPFAKGFRESGQSRCKRKLGSSIASKSTALSNRNTFSPSSPTSKDEDRTLTDETDAGSKRQRTSSFAGSMSSLDDSGLSISESSSRTSSPVIITSDDIRSSPEDERSRLFYTPEVLQQFRENMAPVMTSSWMDLAFTYFSQTHPTTFYPQVRHNYGGSEFNVSSTNPMPYRLPQYATTALAIHSAMAATSNEEFRQESNVNTDKIDVESVASPDNSIKPTKKCNFTISAILGCDI